MNEKEKIKEYFENHDICHTVLSTSTSCGIVTVDVCVDTEDDSVTYHVTDGIEFCYGIYNDFNDAVDVYFAIKESSKGVVFD